MKTSESLNPDYSEIHREIIELSKAGNAKAQYQLYSLYSGAMYGLCLRMMNRKEEAEDMLQEAFTEVFGKLQTFRFESAFGAWVKRIVLNKCINALRKRRPDLRFEDEMRDTADETDTVDYENIVFRVEQVKQAMSSLPDDYRIIFSLYAFEGYDHEEISGILGISESTSKTQYMKAKMKIRDQILNMQ